MGYELLDNWTGLEERDDWVAQRLQGWWEVGGELASTSLGDEGGV